MNPNPSAWTWEDMLQLAPDLPTLDRAKLLLSLRKWPRLEQCEGILWGECRSRGAMRYKVAFNLAQGAFFSNSPASTKPDKYILALLMLWVNDPEAFQPAPAAPDWAIQGLAAAPASAPPKIKPAGVQEVSDKRIAAMTEGLPYLRQWLLDAARQGLAVLQMQEDQAWETLAARLTDHKMAGPARKVREMQAARSQEGWHDLLGRSIAELYLWQESFSRLDELPENLRQEVLVQGGWTVKKEDVLQSPGIEDDWHILYSSQRREGQLLAQQTWLWGAQSGKPALLLDYLWGADDSPSVWKAGEAHHGYLHFYPGALALRAVAGALSPEQAHFKPKAGVCDSLDEITRQYAALAAANPWIGSYPFLLRNAYIIPGSEALRLRDQQNRQAPLETEEDIAPTLEEAAIFQTPLLLFGLWNGRTFQALRVIRQP